MSSTSIESLHSELIGQICQCLDETHPPSLLAFARVSKECYAIASSLLFRTIKLASSDGHRLARSVQKWETLLRREGGFRHVRRLILYWTERTEERHEDHSSLDRCERYDDDSGLRHPWDIYNYNFPPFSESSITNDDWETVVRLVEQLTGLADIFYACPGQFPPCILQTLHAQLPRCRLHDFTFQLRGLERGLMDSHETALASSPCLYSIGELNLANDRMVWDFVRHQASRLKEAHIWLPADDAIDLDDKAGDSHWTGVERRSPVPMEVFHLNRPAFPERPLSFSTISWAVHGDFSALRVLKLDLAITDLDHLPAPNNFPKLVSLAFTCATTPQMGYWNTLLTFLHDLPCLTTLQLRDWNRSVSVMPGLNSKLRTLDFSTRVGMSANPLQEDHIHQLPNICPDLENVTVEIRRSRGKAGEVSLYRALGRLRRLRYLSIILDVSPPRLNSTVEFLDSNGDSISHGTAIEPWFDAEDAKTVQGPLRPYRQGHVHDVLVNSAIDSDLARSIFEIIDKTKASLSEAAVPLERLEIHTAYGDRFAQRSPMSPPKAAILPFLAALSRRWLVERDVRDDARDVLHVTELNREGRLRYSRDQVTRITSSRSNHLFDIWQRVWPSGEEGSNWWENWKNLPLDMEVKETSTEA